LNVAIDRTIFAQTAIDYGPRSLLGRVLLKAEAGARNRGVTLSFATMQEFLDTHARNRATWGAVFRGFDPALNDLNEDNSFCLLGRNEEGEVVATQAGRLYDWTSSCCHEEMEALRLLYSHPDQHKLPTERCEVTALAARAIKGRVFYSGGAWYRPDYRGVGLVSLLPRLARTLACAKWDTSCTMTLMVENNVKKGVFPRNGYRNIEWDVHFIDTREGTIQFALLWMKRDEMLQDLQQFLEQDDSLGALGEQAVVRKRATNA
jgi:hypothetical protein